MQKMLDCTLVFSIICHPSSDSYLIHANKQTNKQKKKSHAILPDVLLTPAEQDSFIIELPGLVKFLEAH